jgi:hypothetical protein
MPRVYCAYCGAPLTRTGKRIRESISKQFFCFRTDHRARFYEQHPECAPDLKQHKEYQKDIGGK